MGEQFEPRRRNLGPSDLNTDLKGRMADEEQRRMKAAKPTEVMNTNKTLGVGEKRCRGVIEVGAMDWGHDALAGLYRATKDYPEALVILHHNVVGDGGFDGATINGDFLPKNGAVLIDEKSGGDTGDFMNRALLNAMAFQGAGLMPVSGMEAAQRMSKEATDVLFQVGPVRYDQITASHIRDGGEEQGYHPSIRAYNVCADVRNTPDGRGTVVLLPQERFESAEYTASQLDGFKMALWDTGSAIGREAEELRRRKDPALSDDVGRKERLQNHFYLACHVLPMEGDPWKPDMEVFGTKGAEPEKVIDSLGIVLAAGPSVVGRAKWPALGAYLEKFRDKLVQRYKPHGGD